MAKFNVTFEIVTPESAVNGEADSLGFVVMAADLRTAIQAIEFSASEASCWPVIGPQWFTHYNFNEDFKTGAVESRSIHIPDSVTEASRQRIARLLGVRV